MDRDTPITELKGVGEKTGRLFGKLDIRTVGELLAAYPRDYEVFGEPVKIGRAVSEESLVGRTPETQFPKTARQI